MTLNSIVPAAPTFTLKSHQQAVHDFMIEHPFAGVWLNIGAGKTLTTLSVLQDVRPVGHILVTAPVPIARSTWLNEIDRWGFPIRTKSLIVDAHDKPLSTEERLAAIRQVPFDPPTMYFINQELITRPSLERPTLVARVPSAMTPKLGPLARQVHELIAACGGLTTDELVAGYRDQQQHAGLRPASKASLHRAIKHLRQLELLELRKMPCRICHGARCPECCFGLVDQLPGPYWPFRTVIIDESQEMKSHTSKRFQALASVRPMIERLYELTGTPAPNGLIDLWSQMYLLDEGAALGHNITAYRDQYFTPKMVPGTTTPAKWIPNAGAEAHIHAAISHLVMSAENTELVLPDENIEVVNVTMPEDARVAYDSFKKEMALEIVNQAGLLQAQANLDAWLRVNTDSAAQAFNQHLQQLPAHARDEARDAYLHLHLDTFWSDPDDKYTHIVIAQNQAVLTSKLMQMASGTLYTSDPDEPNTSALKYEVIHDEKLEMTEYLVRNNGGSPVLIAYHFRADEQRILARLNVAGIEARAFDTSREMVRAWNAGEIPVMVLHPESAGHGLNLQYGGHTLIWYTLPYSLSAFQQTNGRLTRPGQPHPVQIYLLLTKGTHDVLMPGVLDTKAGVQDALVHAVRAELLSI